MEQQQNQNLGQTTKILSKIISILLLALVGAAIGLLIGVLSGLLTGTYDLISFAITGGFFLIILSLIFDLKDYIVRRRR